MSKKATAVGAAMACASLLMLSACSGSSGGGPSQQSAGGREKQMVLGFYGGVIGDAFKQVFVKTCSKSLGVHIAYEEDLDAPRLTKMKAGSSDVDVAVFTDPILPDVRAAGLTKPLPLKEIPNYQQVPASYKSKDSLAVSLAVWGISYNKSKVHPAPTSWNDLLDAKYSGKVTEPAVTYNSSYLTLAAFEDMAGGNMTTNLDPGFTMMKKLRKNSPSFWSSSSDMLQQLQSGAIAMTPFAGGSTADAANQPGGDNLAFVAPKEGAYPVGFNMIISSHAKAPNAAAAFINCVLDPANQAAWVKLYPSFPANTKAAVPQEARRWLGGVNSVSDLKTVDWDKIAKSRDQIVEKWQREIG